MSYTVNATVTNSSPFTLQFQSKNIPWGQCHIQASAIPPGTNVPAFTGSSDAVFSGCQGTVIYGFVDHDGTAHTVQFSYNDPFSGSNSASITVPNGMNGGAYIPQHGSGVNASYDLSGQPSPEPKDASAR